MAFFQIQESPSLFLNTEFIERFQFLPDPSAETGTLTIHFVSGENITISGQHAPEAYESLIGVLTEEAADCDDCE